MAGTALNFQQGPGGSRAILVFSGWLPNGGTFEKWITLDKMDERLKAELRRRNAAALAMMVDLARSRVPVDTGRLLGGITGTALTPDTFEFRASAISPDGQHEDYARFEEFGHATGDGAAVLGGPRVVDESFFTGASAGYSGRSRRARKGEAEPHPFFFNSAAEGLASRGTVQEILDAAANNGIGA